MPTAPNGIRNRTLAALEGGTDIFQAHALLAIVSDAVADCEDPEGKRLGAMTLAEARTAYRQCEYGVSVSISLEALEVIFGESLLPSAVAQPAPTLSATTVELALRALANRQEVVQDELRHLDTYGADHDSRESTDIEAEENMIAEALRELEMLKAATPGTAAC